MTVISAYIGLEAYGVTDQWGRGRMSEGISGYHYFGTI